MGGVYWSAQVELVFYFGIGVLYLAGRTRIATAWSAFSLIALACWLAGTRLDSPLLRSIADSVLLARFALFFSVGRFFYQLCRSHLLSLLLAVTAIVVYVSIWRQQEAAVHASFLLMVLGFGLFIRGWLAWIAVVPLVFVGDISYSLYLIHGNLGVGVIRLLKGTAHLPDFLAAGIATGISIATAWLLVRWVERPARRAVIRWGFERLARGRGRLAPLAFGRPE